MNDWIKAKNLISAFIAEEITAQTFANEYFRLTEGSFSVRSSIADFEVANSVSSIRTACAQFQADPELFKDLMRSSADGNEFVNAEGLRNHVLLVINQAKEAGISIIESPG